MTAYICTCGRRYGLIPALKTYELEIKECDACTQKRAEAEQRKKKRDGVYCSRYYRRKQRRILNQEITT